MNYTEMEAKVREATNNEPWVRTSQSITLYRDLDIQIYIQGRLGIYTVHYPRTKFLTS
jgi:hypothetical protein